MSDSSPFFQDAMEIFFQRGKTARRDTPAPLPSADPAKVAGPLQEKTMSDTQPVPAEDPAPAPIADPPAEAPSPAPDGEEDPEEGEGEE